MRILISGLLVSFAALASGCIIVPVGGGHHHRGYYDGPRGDSVTVHYSDRGGYRGR